MAEDDRTRRARQTAEARYGFMWHLPIYLIVNAGLVVLWLAGGGGFPWPLFPIIFWGIGVGAHYVAAYRTPGDTWIERETQKILNEGAGKGTPGG